ncbi:uncharacterized protein LOC141601571 [Silene latifolia]|uniref:uncharacterized protein LOC141601571 n=1 Tax=Silene latifolia TaxID=37657 RepID=UPI003D77AD98
MSSGSILDDDFEEDNGYGESPIWKAGLDALEASIYGIEPTKKGNEKVDESENVHSTVEVIYSFINDSDVRSDRPEDTCCLPKEEGGLGIKDAKCWNKALLGKYAWWVTSKKDHLWVKWVNHVYIKGTDWSTYTPPSDCSWPWRKIIHIMQVFHQAYTDSKWLNADVPYTVQSGYHWLRIKAPKVEWRHICWNQLNVPKYSFIFWSFMHSRLLTKDRLVRMGITNDPLCDICRLHPEDHHHLFYACEYALACSRMLQNAMKISLPGSGLVQWFSRARRSKFQRRYIGACYVGMFYYIWRIRNEARIDHCIRAPAQVVKLIISEVQSRFTRRNCNKLKSSDIAWLNSIR